MRFRRLCVALGAVGVALAVPLLLAAPAGAQAKQTCEATLDNTPLYVIDRPSRALRVDPDHVIALSGEIGVPMPQETLAHHEVQLEFGGMRWTVDDGTSKGTSWYGSADVAKYSKFGKGLYKVVAKVVWDTGRSCYGVAYVRVGDANPVGSAAGAAAAGATVVGAAATAAAGRKKDGWDTVFEIEGQVEGESDVLSAQRDAADRQRWLREDRPRLVADLEAQKQELAQPPTGVAVCGTVAVGAIGLTLAAMAHDAAHSVVATIGRITR